MSSTPTYDYDLIVIGGGSGGMSCAKQASSLSAKVALFDYVRPIEPGTSSPWHGLGGTCVNVGCVPKKIMHYASLLGTSMHDARTLGWDLKTGSHNWSTLVEVVNNHIHMLNFRYRTALKKKDVDYINAYAKFEDAHTLSYLPKGKTSPSDKKTITAAKIVIAVGGRPYIPSNIPGAREYGITSDDIFSLDHPPGKTLIIGGSYIALECAGFLRELGYDVSIAVRSILLRGFDRQCADKIGSYMQELGTKFLYEVALVSIIRDTKTQRLHVTYRDKDGHPHVDVYDTVLFATGRRPDVSGLNLQAAGVHAHNDNKKIVVYDNDSQTNVDHIYAVGDVVQGKQELTPVAIHVGELLAKRLFGGSTKKMDYNHVATTIFTPIEYGSVGKSEEQAIASYGHDDVEVYLSEFTTLEISAVHRPQHGSDDNNDNDDDNREDMNANCLSKLITIKSQDNRVVGFHFIGPNAGEVTQGFALALKLGAKKQDFDDLVGIHPTDAESFCSLSITKRSGVDYKANGGCGGGVCG